MNVEIERKRGGEGWGRCEGVGERGGREGKSGCSAGYEGGAECGVVGRVEKLR
jgi:hypothetical protein